MTRMNRSDSPSAPSEPLVSQAAPELHHYTNLAGLRGILSTQTLWAVRFDSMNDPTEFNFVREILIDAMMPRVREYVRKGRLKSGKINKIVLEAGGIERLVAHETGVWIDTLHGSLTKTRHNAPFVIPHVTSFCNHTGEAYESENGLLSQWRGYGDAQAFSIVFETASLEALMREEIKRHQYIGGFFTSVQYANEAFDVNEKHSLLLNHIEVAWKGFIRNQPPSLEGVLEPLIKAAIRIKHRAFSEEREVRIVTLPVSSEYAGSPEAEVDERPLKPHLPEPRPHISLFGPELGQLPIKRIIIGPCSDQERAVENAKSLVGDRWPITISKTPFRRVEK